MRQVKISGLFFLPNDHLVYGSIEMGELPLGLNSDMLHFLSGYVELLMMIPMKILLINMEVQFDIMGTIDYLFVLNDDMNRLYGPYGPMVL
ncbi:hypothetical protein V2J09_013684 [Rumex salicifolius]